MAGPSPLNSACRCCSQPPTVIVYLEHASVAQSCNTTSCGELPCTSTEAVYDDEGNCITTEQACSPNWADLTRSEKCAAKRYLTITEVDRSGGGNHGRTRVRQYTADEDGNCDLETTCSGSRTETTVETGTFTTVSGPTPACSSATKSGGSETTTTLTTTWNNDCTTTTETECSGSSNTSFTCTSLFGGTTSTSICESDYLKIDGECQWQGEQDGTDDWGDPIKEPFNDNCLRSSALFNGATFESTLTITPSNLCKITTTYTGANEQGSCIPKALPSFPAFTDCTPDGEEPPESPELEEGQGYASEAYNFKNPYNALITSKQNVKYRVIHGSSGTCYLKVWFRNKVQKYKYEDCDSGFAGDPPRTAPLTIDCNPPAPAIECSSRWSTDGEPTFVENGTYEWRGNGYPCLADEDKYQQACENIIHASGSGIKIVTPEENTSVTIEYKYSFIENYEPDWADENGCQGCKPNGYPIPNPEDCPVCA